MTENEAKTKWCPFVRVSAGAGCIGGVSNRQDGSHNKTPDGNPNCIGSACMAWREAEPEFGEILESRPADPGTANPDPEHWGYHMPTESWVRRQMIRKFYCGLAGKP
jgi:hypothetical protein